MGRVRNECGDMCDDVHCRCLDKEVHETSEEGGVEHDKRANVAADAVTTRRAAPCCDRERAAEVECPPVAVDHMYMWCSGSHSKGIRLATATRSVAHVGSAGRDPTTFHRIPLSGTSDTYRSGEYGWDLILSQYGVWYPIPSW